MNKERLLAVADAIERETIHDLGFNMSNWKSTREHTTMLYASSCGTTACVAGHVVALFQPKRFQDWDANFVMEGLAMEELVGRFDPTRPVDRIIEQLRERDELHKLFHGMDGKGRQYFLYDIPREMAVIAIRRLVETGKTDWEEAERIYQCQTKDPVHLRSHYIRIVPA